MFQIGDQTYQNNENTELKEIFSWEARLKNNFEEAKS